VAEHARRLAALFAPGKMQGVRPPQQHAHGPPASRAARLEWPPLTAAAARDPLRQRPHQSQLLTLVAQFLAHYHGTYYHPPHPPPQPVELYALLIDRLLALHNGQSAPEARHTVSHAPTLARAVSAIMRGVLAVDYVLNDAAGTQCMVWTADPWLRAAAAASVFDTAPPPAAPFAVFHKSTQWTTQFLRVLKTATLSPAALAQFMHAA
jgi:hypothetical protein